MNQRRICRNIANALLIPFNSATKEICERSLYSVSHRNRHQFYGMPFKTSTSVAITIYIKQLEKLLFFSLHRETENFFQCMVFTELTRNKRKFTKLQNSHGNRCFLQKKLQLSHIRISLMDST